MKKDLKICWYALSVVSIIVVCINDIVEIWTNPKEIEE